MFQREQPQALRLPPVAQPRLDRLRERDNILGVAVEGGPALVMVHGFGACLETWHDVYPALAEEFSVVRLDLKGAGFSAKPRDERYALRDQAGIVLDFLKALHKNINQYTKSGAAPARAAATGESLVGITFQHDAVVQAVAGAPVKIVSPCEGTGYEIGSMSIIKGAKNMENAKKWYDWALSAEAQSIGSAAKVSYQVPSNKSASVPAAAPKLGDIKLINYDFAKYGSSAERKRLLSKWDTDVSTLPK